ncbi:nicolin-1 isoform X2 [Callorhinchus milii]|uniref:nicolin-1 isoform X2 n=1 Tax=Callorhinchus milii TaxID=7868 RepID=UPI001C3F628D|nr:nicolin-1 isoform X2 [Callorhinchus milii]
MTEDSVACVIKTPVPLQIGDIKSNSGKPGVFAIDISFPRERGINMLCEPNGVTAMRLILRQPSPVWLSFSVEDIKLYECDQDNLQRGNGSWLSHLTPLERPLNLNVGLPDPEAVASSVQHMWLLTEMVRNTPTCTRVGRFDVDGSYDINLLSYT